MTPSQQEHLSVLVGWTDEEYRKQRDKFTDFHIKALGLSSLEEMDAVVAEARSARCNPTPRKLGAKVDTSKVKNITWHWKRYFPGGKLVIIDGDPGLTKSMFTIRMIVSYLNNEIPFIDGSFATVTGHVILMSAEDDLEDTINPRLLAAGAAVGPLNITYIKVTENGRSFDLNDPADLESLRQEIKSKNTKLVIIDPLNAYLGEKVNADNDKSIRRVLSPLSELANETGCLIICLRHLNKGGGGKAIYRGLGSIGYTAAARATFFIAAHPEKQDKFVFAWAKGNLSAKPPSLEYSLGFTEVPGIDGLVPYVSQATECELTANELAAGGGEENKFQAAIEFLESFLEFEPRTAKEVESGAFKRKIAPQTLRRAREKMKIKPYQKEKKWWWELPDGQSRTKF